MRPPLFLLVSLLLSSGAASVRAQCVAASASWQNAAFAPQSAPFTARFTAAPSAARIDGVTGLSQSAATGFSSLAVAVRFNNAGYLDARNGGVYAAGASIPYTAGAVYGFRIAVDPPAKRYSVWVTPPGAAERALAANFAYRTEQASAGSLANWALISTAGTHQVCGFTLAAPPAPADTAPPTVTVVSPLAGAALSGTVALTANAFDGVGVAGVQFQVDGALVGPELTQAPYTTAWNTAAASNASHLVTAVARDAAGNKATSPAVTVVVNNAVAPPAGCVAVSSVWKSAAFAPQNGAFNATFEAVPGAAKMDGVTGLANGSPADYSKLAATVRFNNAGYIDARDGGAYGAAAAIPYTAGARYRFRLAVDTAARRYSAFVTPPGGAELLVGSSLSFRGGASDGAALDHWGAVAGSASHQVCGFALSAPPPPPPPADTTPPAAAFVSPAAGATVSGTVALSVSATDAAGVAGVQFQLDGADLGAELTKAPYSLAWNTAAASNGSHTLKAVARDAAGNKGSASVVVTVSNAPAPPACVALTSAWQGAAFAPQSGSFVSTFDAVPGAAMMDGVTGLSDGAAASYAALAAAVRFNNAGYIDARDGAAYAAAAAIPYTPGASYRFRVVVDVAARRYSAYVTPPGSAERLIGGPLAFRTEQASVTRLDRWAGFAGSGSHQVCGFTAAAAPAPVADTTAPAAAFVSPAAGATVSGSVTLTATATDAVGVTGVKFQLDGVDLGAELLQAPYTLAWNTLPATNAAHTLKAIARDAAGNLGTATVSVTVNNAPPPSAADRFGIKRLYPTMAGGKDWVSAWDNGRARSFASGQSDPDDPWFRGRGDASYSVDGKGVFSMSGAVPRMYIHDPAQLHDWRNTESTVYAYRVADSGIAYGGIVHITRTNHSAIGASETINGCDSRGNGARFRYDGHIDFEKETKHPASSPVQNKTVWSTLPFRTWIGYKLVVYDLPNGNVKLENYMDLTDGAGGGTWTKVNELEDNGSNFGVGGTPCKSGIDPALRLTTSNARPGSETGRPNAAVYFRTDGVGTNGLLYKKMSVREITPP